MANSKVADCSSLDYFMQKNIVPYETGSFLKVILLPVQHDRESIGEKGKPRVFQSRKGDEIYAVSTRDCDQVLWSLVGQRAHPLVH